MWFRGEEAGAGRVQWKRVLRPALLFGFETVALTKGQEAELKILRYCLRVIRMEMINNKYIRGTAKLRHFGG